MLMGKCWFSCVFFAAVLGMSVAAKTVSPDRREYVRPSLGNLTPEAKALLEEYAKRGEARKPVFKSPKWVVRGQFRYGNDREDFIHAWYERPLYQDSSLIAAREKGHFINAESWKLDVACMKEAKYDAFAFFPKNPGCMDVFHRSLLPGGEVTIVPQFAWSYSDTDWRSLAEKTLAAPNALRFGGKVVIPFFGSIGWWEKEKLERLRRFRADLTKKFGPDRFALIVWFRFFREYELNRQRMDADTLRAVHEGMCSAMRDADGMFYSLLDINWMPYDCSDIPNRTILIPLVKSVMAESESRGKYLGIEWYTGHQNTYRRITDCSCMGMERQRRAMESFRMLQPDFTWASEWDEANENDHLCPTVSGAKAVSRMVRFYVDDLAGRNPTPYPGDDTSIPNLVLCYRKALVLGEYVEAQLVNIPDGTAKGDYTVAFRWTTPDGRVVKAFPQRKLSATRCCQETFAVSSVDVASERVLLPELTVIDQSGCKKVFKDGFWPLGIEGTRTLDAYWVRHPLREICSGVSGQLRIGAKEPDGTYVVTGSIAGPKKFRSIEVLENSDSVYMYDSGNAMPKNGVDISVSFKTLGVNRYRRAWPECQVYLVTPQGRVQGDCGTYRDFKDFRFFVPTEEVASSTVEIDLPKEEFRKRLSVADIVRDDAYSFAVSGGGQAVIRRVYGTHRIPEPAMVEKAEFSFRMKPLDPTANLRLQAVDEDYRVWRGPLSSFYRPSGKMKTVHVFDDEIDGARVVKVDEARLYSLDYDFSRRRADDMVYPLCGRRDSPCVFGGSVSLVTGIGFGHEDCWYQHALADVQGDFRNVGRFASLPMQFNPWRAGFSVTLKIRPKDLEGRQYLLDSWATGFKLRLEGCVPVAHLNDGTRLWREGVNMMSGATLVGSALKVGEWNTITVDFNQQVAHISVNGTMGDSLPLCGVEANPHTMSLGCSTNGRYPFRGEFGTLVVCPK